MSGKFVTRNPNAKNTEFAKPEEIFQLFGYEVAFAPQFEHFLKAPIYIDQDLLKKI